MKRHQYFNFTEINFKKEKKRFEDFIKQTSQKNKKCFFKLPPCIDKEQIIKNNLKTISIDTNEYFITHNLFYGSEFKKINKKFQNSPFISKECKKCKLFKEYLCRGLTNNKFEIKKKKIIKKRGKKEYGAIVTEYSTGHAGYSSNCNANCFFCPRQSTYINKHKIYITNLSISEIIHFSHYLPWYGTTTNMFRNEQIIPGEPLLSENIETKLKISNHFSINKLWIMTNGLTLTSHLLNIIKNLKINLDISFHSANHIIRKKMMQHNKEINLEKTLLEIKKKKIPLTIKIIATKKNIENNDLKNTIEYLNKLNIIPIIHSAQFYQDIDIEYQNQLDIDYFKLKNKLEKDKLKAIFYKDEEIKNIHKIKNEILKLLNSKELKNKRIHILVPKEDIFNKLKNLKNSNVKITPVNNSEPTHIKTPGTTHIKNYIEILEKEDNSKIIIIPTHTFNSPNIPTIDFINKYMKDKNNKDINDLLDKINKKLYILQINYWE